LGGGWGDCGGARGELGDGVEEVALVLGEGEGPVRADVDDQIEPRGERREVEAEDLAE
jgi:hypothetical protein